MTDKSEKSAKSLGNLSAEDRAEFKDRLSKLDDRLDDAQGRQPKPEPSSGHGKAMGYGLRIATDIIAAILVGAGIGWYLDKWLETKPIMLLIFITIGLAAGVRNVIRTYRMMTEEFGTNTGTDLDNLSGPNTTNDDEDRV